MYLRRLIEKTQPVARKCKQYLLHRRNYTLPQSFTKESSYLVQLSSECISGSPVFISSFDIIYEYPRRVYLDLLFRCVIATQRPKDVDKLLVKH